MSNISKKNQEFKKKRIAKKTLNKLIENHKRIQKLTASSKISWADIVIENREDRI